MTGAGFWVRRGKTTPFSRAEAIESGIFGLPALLAARLGSLSPLACTRRVHAQLRPAHCVRRLVCVASSDAEFLRLIKVAVSNSDAILHQ